MRLFQLHLGREVSVYALYGTLAAKANLINRENVFPSGERRVCPDESVEIAFPSGEKGVWPDGSKLNVSQYGERVVWPYGNG